MSSPRLVQAADWQATALGDPAHWPLPLRLAADIAFNCPAPMLLAWDQPPAVLCNDAYAGLAGAAAGALPALPGWLAERAGALAAARRGQAQLLAGQALAFPARPASDRQYDVYLTPLCGTGGQADGVLCTLAPSATAEPAAEAPGLRILVVEDNLDSQYLVCEMLRAFGHAAEGVSHAEDALPLLATGTWQVLFSDVSLPGMSGVELARRALSQQPQLHVIFASGYGQGLLQQIEFPHQALQKPYDIDSLQAQLARISAQIYP